MKNLWENIRKIIIFFCNPVFLQNITFFVKNVRYYQNVTINALAVFLLAWNERKSEKEKLTLR